LHELGRAIALEERAAIRGRRVRREADDRRLRVSGEGIGDRPNARVHRNADRESVARGAAELWSEARKNLFPLIEQVNDDRTPVEITSRRGDAVLLSRADYDALEETAHLLRVPANAKRLLESLQQARSGQREEHELNR